ncbi:hypothetical protein Cgig2_004202 [Carnegiea gigantea]|uniref:Response regulatory domain-containing protein n=1 Tax=Carnegiea gigantea TaxID=171969 RepID=A0A9Q1KV18_9CARY|nr:hypothetical protein Cgig2_004202 [Carnegiea gigantea]
MARLSGGVHRQCKSEKIEISDRLCLDMQEFHVLAVDDSFVDRKVIERLLKISSCKVTVVDSGKRALQFLGLDEERSSAESNRKFSSVLLLSIVVSVFSVLKQESSMFREVPVVIMSSENILTRIARCMEKGAKEYIVKPVKLSDVNRLRAFIMASHSDGVKGKESLELSIPEIHNPIFVGYPCSTPECACILNHPSPHTRSSKDHSQLTLQ